MAKITLDQAQQQLDAALAAYLAAVSKPNSYSHGSDSESFSASQHSLESLEAAVTFWEKRVAKLTRGSMPVRTIIPTC